MQASYQETKNPDQRYRFLLQRQGNVCAFTGQPFHERGQKSPEGDHCHKSLVFRGFVWAVVNRFCGAAEYIMKETGWSSDELCEALYDYLAKPGLDIGLEPYPTHLGFATAEEAVAYYQTHPLSNATN